MFLAIKNLFEKNRANFMSFYTIETGALNILEQQAKDSKIREQLLELFKKDFFFYHFANGVNYFKKRGDFLDKYSLIDNKSYFKYRDRKSVV